MVGDTYGTRGPFSFDNVRAVDSMQDQGQNGMDEHQYMDSHVQRKPKTYI